MRDAVGKNVHGLGGSHAGGLIGVRLQGFVAPSRRFPKKRQNFIGFVSLRTVAADEMKRRTANKKTAPEPTKGSMSRAPVGNHALIRSISRNFPPAHFKKGL